MLPHHVHVASHLTYFFLTLIGTDQKPQIKAFLQFLGPQSIHIVIELRVHPVTSAI